MSSFTGVAQGRIVAAQASRRHDGGLVEPEYQVEALRQLETVIAGQGFHPCAGILHRAQGLAAGDLAQDALGLARVRQGVGGILGK